MFFRIFVPLFSLILFILPASANKVEINYTPLMVSNMQPPISVEGLDGKSHLAYELRLTNGGGFETKLRSIDVLDQDKKVIKTYSGLELNQNVTLGGKSNIEFKSGDTAFVWITFSVDNKQIPKSLTHRLTYDIQGTDKPGAPLISPEVVVESDKLKVELNDLLIGPPLSGKGWVAIGGIGTDTGHRRALLSLNNKLCLSQRFANDWVKLDENNRSCSGDNNKCKSFTCYNEKIIAVADGEVVDLVDGFDDQIPNKTGRVKVSDAGGNYLMVKIDDNKFAFYAHMKKGSTRVKIGDQVKRGQEIGNVGNSGNSSAPHLHFHICDNPSPLFANGVPFVIDEFDVQGKYKSEDEFFKCDDEAKPQDIVPVLPGKHKRQMPLAGFIVDFP